MGCTPGMRGCIGKACGHYDWVDSYRQEVERHAVAAENASLGYATELKEWLADNPIPRLKDWMKHREKAPEMVEDLGRMTWTKDEQPAQIARFREMEAADRAVEAATEKAEMQRYLGTDIEQPTVDEIRAYNETGLLGAAMISDEAIPALRTVRNEFTDVFHENVGRVILHQESVGGPRDPATVTAILKEADQLPLGYDPAVAMYSVDPSEYGLATWAKGANPAEAEANALAQKMREDTRGRHLERVGERLRDAARASIEAGEDPGLAFAQAANELVSTPAKLDLDLREIRNTATLEAVDTRKPRVLPVASEATKPRLGLPDRPATMNLKAVASA